MTSKPEKDVIIPTTRTYPTPKKPRKVYRTGWIDGKGCEVPKIPEHRGRPRTRLTDYDAGFTWKPDPMVCIMLDTLCSEWETTRHEVLRRLMTPFVYEVVNTLKEERNTFTLEHTWDMRPSEWPDWKKR